MPLLKSIKLQPDEQVIKIVRRGSLTYFWWYFLSLVLIALPFFFMFWLFSWGRPGAAVFAALLLAGIYLLFRAIFLWYHNGLVITSQRLIKLAQLGAWHKQVSEVSYDNLSQISSEVKGLRQSIFKFGSLKAESEGGQTVLTFSGLRHPFRVQQIITTAQNNYKRRAGYSPALLERLNQLPPEELKKIIDLLQNKLKVER